MMNLLYFILLCIITWVLLMQIFKLTAYHKYFWKTFFLIIIYSFWVSFSIIKLNFSKFFYLYLILSIILLIYNNLKQRTDLKKLTELHDNNSTELSTVKLSGERTIKYHLLSSIVFIISIVISMFYIINVDQ